MTFLVRYADVVDVDVKRMNWRTAARACKAVQDFAATGKGAVEKRADGTYQLRVAGAVVLFTVDRQALEIHVLRVLPS